MIEIVFFRKYARVTAKGHAGTAEKGQDLVCAAVSALMYTLAANVQNLSDTGKARNPVIRLDEGDAEVSISTRAGYIAMTEMIFRTVCIGFEILSKQYPDAIHYEVHG